MLTITKSFIIFVERKYEDDLTEKINKKFYYNIGYSHRYNRTIIEGIIFEKYIEEFKTILDALPYDVLLRI